MALFFYKEKNKDIRAAAYLRLSIEDGDKAESNSIGNQRELIRDFAAERPGLHLVEEYADDGYTGTNFERPGFKRMMEDIKSGKINCIIATLCTMSAAASATGRWTLLWSTMCKLCGRRSAAEKCSAPCPAVSIPPCWLPCWPRPSASS